MSFYEVEALSEAQKQKDEFELAQVRKVIRATFIGARIPKNRIPKEKDIIPLSFDRSSMEEIRETAEWLKQRRNGRRSRNKVRGKH